MIDLPAAQLREIVCIVRRHFPQGEIFAFGSRARSDAGGAGKGKAGRFSDLDLMIKADGGVPWQKLADMRESLENSTLPIMVDVVDWSTCTDAFRAMVTPDLVRVD